MNPAATSMTTRDISVATNVFEVTRLPVATYYQYSVSFNPDIDKKAWRKRADLVRHLQYIVYSRDFPVIFLFDGGAVGFAHEKLCKELGAQKTYRLRLRDNVPPEGNARGVYEVTFKSVGVSITPRSLNQLITRNEDFPDRLSHVSFLQLMIRQDSNNLHPNNGKAYFPAKHTDRQNDDGIRQIDGSYLDLRRGIFHSVRPAIGRMSIVVDCVVAPFFRAGFLIDSALGALSRGRGMNDIRALQNLDAGGLASLKRIYKGVFIRETKGNPPREGHRRKIHGFVANGGLYQFENNEGTMITVAEHYHRVHNMTVRYPKIPGVVLREKPTLEVVPMEFCKLEPDQLFKKSLREHETRAMVEFATLPPNAKLNRIHAANEYYARSNSLQDAGLEVSRRTITAAGRQFSPPTILFRNGSISVSEGKWNVVNKQLYRTAGRCAWGVMNLDPLKVRSLGPHIRQLQINARNLGIPLEDPLLTETVNPQSGDVEARLNSFMAVIENKIGDAYQAMLRGHGFFILVILPQEAAILRAIVKHWGDVTKGVLTQCVREDKISKLNDRNSSQYWNNVLLKINARQDGENSRIAGSTKLDSLAKNGRVAMFVGSDVSHPGPGVRKPSVASLVYNQDPQAIRYNAITRLQDPRQEVIVDLEEMFAGALFDLTKIARRAITDIIFYRDGVSEGEYEDIRNAEISAIRRAIDQVWGSLENLKNGNYPKPKLTFIVVGKRHHTLLFPSAPNQGDRKGNCPAGVVVDRDISQPLVPDFYLLSHAGIIGTSRPSHYVVLQNEVFDNDTKALEEISYALCHVYAKATRSVSLPAPVYYADLACGRGSFHYAPSVEEGLRERDSQSVSSGMDAPFDIDSWKQAFGTTHPNLKGNMYFL